MSNAHGRVARRVATIAAAAVFVGALDAGVVLAADGQQLCIDGPGKAVSTPSSDGQCRRGETLTTLAAQSQVDALQAKIETLETANATLTQTVDALQAKIETLETANATLTQTVGELQNKLSRVSYDATGLNGRPTLTLAGANLQIVNGQGTTDTVNGLGNLFVGYDEGAGSQTGSHNIILGTHQTFSSYGGIAGGGNNTLSGPGSVVFGGANTASGSRSAVTGGSSNVASGPVSWIGGAQNSDATAQNASVSGGANNTASRAFASISGGSNNIASGFASSVSGGGLNDAIGDNSSILGGRDITVNTQYGTSP
jgi:FtsZ-binding cell division protein ZapB